MSYVLASIFNKIARGESLSDYEFILVKEFEGKRKQYGGSLNPSGTSSWEYVVPNGKTFWMYYYALTATDDDESNKRQDMVLSGDGTSIVSIEGRRAQHGQSRSTSNTMSLTGLPTS